MENLGAGYSRSTASQRYKQLTEDNIRNSMPGAEATTRNIRTKAQMSLLQKKQPEMGKVLVNIQQTQRVDVEGEWGGEWQNSLRNCHKSMDNNFGDIRAASLDENAPLFRNRLISSKLNALTNTLHLESNLNQNSPQYSQPVRITQRKPTPRKGMLVFGLLPRKEQETMHIKQQIYNGPKFQHKLVSRSNSQRKCRTLVASTSPCRNTHSNRIMAKGAEVQAKKRLREVKRKKYQGQVWEETFKIYHEFLMPLDQDRLKMEPNNSNTSNGSKNGQKQNIFGLHTAQTYYRYKNSRKII